MSVNEATPQLQVNKRASSKPFEADRVRQYLEAVLVSKESPPPSMQEVARRLECDRRTIYRHFRDLCRAISAQYLSYQKHYYQETMEQYCLKVRQIAFRLHYEGEYPTEALSQLISAPWLLSLQESLSCFTRS